MGDEQPDGKKGTGGKLFEKVPGTIKELAPLIVKLNTRVEAMDSHIHEELDSLQKSVQFMSKSFDLFKKSLEDTQKEVRGLKEENARLSKENCELTKQVKETKDDLAELQQYSRRANLELKGVPKSTDKTEREIVTALATKVGVTLSTTDIDVAHWVPTKQKNVSNIVIKFMSCAARDKLLGATKKVRLNTSDLGIAGSMPVYLNEHLCPTYKALLGKAIAAKKRYNWRHTWVTNGRILMKKADNSETIRIRNEADLAQIS